MKIGKKALGRIARGNMPDDAAVVYDMAAELLEARKKLEARATHCPACYSEHDASLKCLKLSGT